MKKALRFERLGDVRISLGTFKQSILRLLKFRAPLCYSSKFSRDFLSFIYSRKRFVCGAGQLMEIPLVKFKPQGHSMDRFINCRRNLKQNVLLKNCFFFSRDMNLLGCFKDYNLWKIPTWRTYLESRTFPQD